MKSTYESVCCFGKWSLFGWVPLTASFWEALVRSAFDGYGVVCSCLLPLPIGQSWIEPDGQWHFSCINRSTSQYFIPPTSHLKSTTY